MSKDYVALDRHYRQESGPLYRDGGAPMEAFRSLLAANARDGALSHKTKELMALALGIALRCEGCVVLHTRACVRLGATREEILETIGVAVEMGGGPATIYGAEALACFDQMSGA